MTWQETIEHRRAIRQPDPEQDNTPKRTNLFNEQVIKHPKKTVAKKIKKKKLKHSCKALECLICTLRFSLEDILCGRYNLETWICSFCYSEMQQKPHVQSCFGKPTVIQLNGKRDLGYDPSAKDCRDLCPDRVLCKRIVHPDLPAQV